MSQTKCPNCGGHLICDADIERGAHIHDVHTADREIERLRTRVAELDERINAAVDQLFRVGEHNEAGRLVLECIWDGSDGGGWCRSAVRDVLRAALRADDAP